MDRPTFVAGLTSWFNHLLRDEGYDGPIVFLRADRSRAFIIGPEGTLDLEELSVSDATLFSEFGTARLEVFADGTSILFSTEDFGQDDQDIEDEEDEGDWNM
ncbi:hypothetical protein QM012_001009 [Aureobasidium pullulans]|uniref:Uncharacterized protein n=1 Tax=Aureobasidium pullulans TaxID=5580 RepID=A0ABR0TFF4_AURPU